MRCKRNRYRMEEATSFRAATSKQGPWNLCGEDGFSQGRRQGRRIRAFMVGPERFLFLSDYATVYEQLDAASRWNTSSTKTHGLVGGQPGIGKPTPQSFPRRLNLLWNLSADRALGKSFSLMYFLTQRLEDARPTSFVLGGAVYQLMARTTRCKNSVV